MERGFLIHNAQLLNNGFRMYQLDLYDRSDEFYKLLCTSTILEGVNLSAKNIIITSPSRFKNKFDAFDFYNLVGRTGRLYHHHLGYAFYLKEPSDPEYSISDAVKKIRFEATDVSEDFDFHTNDEKECEQYAHLLEKLNISSGEYKENIGAKYKIKRVSETYESFIKEKNILVSELELLIKDNARSRCPLIEILYRIVEYQESNTFKIKFNCFLINKLINRNRLKVKTIIKDTLSNKNFKKTKIDYIISSILRLKSSYIEHEFYSLCKIIMFFMKCEGIEEHLIEMINQKVVSCIEFIYFSDSKCKKTLKDLGIYEYDIEKIIRIIGNDLDNVNDIYDALKNNKFDNLNFISEYIINRL